MDLGSPGLNPRRRWGATRVDGSLADAVLTVPARIEASGQQV
jgi:hypothetical protein